MGTAGAYMYLLGLLEGHCGRLWVAFTYLRVYCFARSVFLLVVFLSVSPGGIRSVWVSMCCADIMLFELGQGTRLYQKSDTKMLRIAMLQ